ncbi:phosphocarrier protein HPr /phosphoenolpyruvate--protein phosphotransferase /PTS system IIA component (Glc family) [Nitrospirillum amazonense]|uniref:phosphoenolpyruvate--protein phosphotransferase n=1 Tax=Nitrospirillum amazonense TaxID=28077 RepID=A0A560F5K8_9PROT|nr:phosphocarrier protein HPr /phosphoenolpyruvate--protein phosphotransferase /PTS system IIA component (Glc family) [Nitrospirillum amazonense]
MVGNGTPTGTASGNGGGVTRLILLAPLDGWATPLDEVPDPVFAQRMMGEGLALDPTGATLRAPCDGVVLTVHRARHAVTLRADCGVEILMHVGLETVALGGRGFTVHVAEGALVRAGDALIDFDMDLLAREAKSLLTPLIIAGGPAATVVEARTGTPVRAGEVLLTLLVQGDGAASAAAGERTQSAEQSVVLPLVHGLHARPSAVLAAAAKPYAAAVFLAAQGRRANAKSAVAAMSLGLRHGDALTVLAEGEDAAAAVAAVAAAISAGLGETPVALAEALPVPSLPSAAVPPHDEPPALEAQPPFAPGETAVIRAVTAAPGLALGRAFRLQEEEVEVPAGGLGADAEQAALAAALDRVRTRLAAAVAHAEETRQTQRRDIFQAHLAILDDPDLLDEAQAAITGGEAAGSAWRAATDRSAAALRALGNPRMAERAADLIDLRRQVMLALAGREPQPVILPQGAILVAEELMPSQLSNLDAGRLAGFCTARGGPTSHVAILAASMGVPALVAGGAAVLRIPDDAPLILDADRGLLHVQPPADDLAKLERETARRKVVAEANLKAAAADCVMADGTRIEVYTNVGKVADAVKGVAKGAEGCGLLRTEFLFLDRQTAPDEDEQAAQYQAVATALQGRPLIIRTLDVGGDKPLPYLPLPREENPILGLRGVRIGLRRPEILRTQLRAILRVRPVGQCRIMVPMVATLDEVRAVRDMLDHEREALGHAPPVQLGVMVETPAAAVTADQLATEADFLSIGTNDLTQYVLAMDRGNPDLAARLDALHPAVLRLIRQTAEGAARHGRWVGVCGALASDPAAAPLLVGLGVTELSATPPTIPDIKAALRPLDKAACVALATEALAQESAAAVRSLLARAGLAVAITEGAA